VQRLDIGRPESDEDFTRTELTFGGALIFVAIALAIALLRNRFDLP